MEDVAGTPAEQDVASGTSAEQDDGPPDRVRRAATVLSCRTKSIVLVLERCSDSNNYQACLRTAEAFGVQEVWFVEPLLERKHDKVNHRLNRKITKNSFKWLTLREFSTTHDCIRAMRNRGLSIWATDLAPQAIPLDKECRARLGAFPARGAAVVIGRESDGVSEAMLAEADERMYLPMFGFTESFNLSVATAMMLQRLFDSYPEIRGNLDDEDRRLIWKEWCGHLSEKNATLRKKVMKWANKLDEVPLLGDTRRDDSKEVRLTVLPKIRKREQQIEEEQERQAVRDSEQERQCAS